MGNQGWAGFCVSLDGLPVVGHLPGFCSTCSELSPQWPYLYNSCNVGMLWNQTYLGQKLSLAFTENGNPQCLDRPAFALTCHLCLTCSVQSCLPDQCLSAYTYIHVPVNPIILYAKMVAMYMGWLVFESTVDGGVGKVWYMSVWVG